VWYKDLKLKDALRMFRLRSDLTQTEFAKRVGTTSISISLWESGKHTPGLPSLGRLLGAMEIPPEHWGPFINLPRVPAPKKKQKKGVSNVKAEDKRRDLEKIPHKADRPSAAGNGTAAVGVDLPRPTARGHSQLDSWLLGDTLPRRPRTVHRWVNSGVFLRAELISGL